jgi:hypothetical protein
MVQVLNPWAGGVSEENNVEVECLRETLGGQTTVCREKQLGGESFWMVASVMTRKKPAELTLKVK